MQQATKDFWNPFKNKEFSQKFGTAAGIFLLALLSWLTSLISGCTLANVEHYGWDSNASEWVMTVKDKTVYVGQQMPSDVTQVDNVMAAGLFSNVVSIGLMSGYRVSFPGYGQGTVFPCLSILNDLDAADNGSAAGAQVWANFRACLEAQTTGEHVDLVPPPVPLPVPGGSVQ